MRFVYLLAYKQYLDGVNRCRIFLSGLTASSLLLAFAGLPSAIKGIMLDASGRFASQGRSMNPQMRPVNQSKGKIFQIHLSLVPCDSMKMSCLDWSGLYVGLISGNYHMHQDPKINEMHVGKAQKEIRCMLYSFEICPFQSWISNRMRFKDKSCSLGSGPPSKIISQRISDISWSLISQIRGTLQL